MFRHKVEGPLEFISSNEHCITMLRNDGTVERITRALMTKSSPPKPKCWDDSDDFEVPNTDDAAEAASEARDSRGYDIGRVQVEQNTRNGHRAAIIFTST